MRAQLANISDVKADGKNVVVTLASGNADVPYLMAEYSLGIFPATADGVDWQSGIGTGGYAIEEFKPGIQTHLKRNANYYKADRANFDEIFMVSINDKTARQSALMSGQVDVVDGIDPKTAQVVAAQQSARLIEVKGSGGNYHQVGVLDGSSPIKVIDGPGTFRVTRTAASSSIGVDQG